MPILAPIVSATPTPPPVASNWGSLVVTWTGWDGSQWTLSDGRDSGVFLTATGTRGLIMPPIQRYTSESPALPGSRWRGSRVQERECFWPLFVYSDASSAEWLARDRAFWATMRPDLPGSWAVADLDGHTRTLSCRFVSADDSLDADPLFRGWQAYGVTLVAEQPYWLGATVSKSFRNSAPVPFFGGATGGGKAPSFFISSGSTLANATIDNPGDIDAPLIYVLDGPWDAGASVGVGDAQTVYGAAIPDGQSVVIDTRPDWLGARQVATPTDPVGSAEWLAAIEADGTDVFTSLSAIALNITVPSGASQSLQISASGTGALHVALSPRFYRAW